MEKYSKTLITNFKISLRDIVSTKEEEEDEKKELSLLAEKASCNKL